LNLPELATSPPHLLAGGNRCRYNNGWFQNDLTPQRPRDQTGALCLFKQAQAALAVSLHADAQEGTQDDPAEMKAAFSFFDRALDSYLKRLNFELGELGDHSKCSDKASCHGRQEKVFGRPESGLALKFGRSGEL
jgi:hypothetical protein